MAVVGPVTTASWVPGPPGKIADKRKAQIPPPLGNAITTSLATLKDMGTMATALQALDAAYYTDARLTYMTANDMRHALLAQENPKAWD